MLNASLWHGLRLVEISLRHDVFVFFCEILHEKAAVLELRRTHVHRVVLLLLVRFLGIHISLIELLVQVP